MMTGLQLTPWSKTMLRFKWIAGVAAVLGAVFNPGRGADDETYDLRGPGPQEKQVLVSKSTSTMKKGKLTLGSGDAKVDLNLSIAAVEEKETRLLVVKGREVTKCQTKYGKSRAEITATADGKEETETEPDPLENETVISERVDGKWKNVLVDTKPNEKQKKELVNFQGEENDDARFPKEKVKVGHTWTVEAPAMSKALEHEFIELKGTVKQKFVKIEKIGQEDCAVIESDGKITGKTKEGGDLTGDVELVMKFTTWRSLKTGVIVKEKYEGTLKLTGKATMDDMKADATLSGEITGEITTKLK
jgi:hypothetical protein